MKNRRSRNTLHKKYRRYRSDIWGKLAIKRRDNFITRLVYDYSILALRNRLRLVSKKKKKLITKFFGKTLNRSSQKNFSYQINVQAVQRRVRPNSQRGIL